MLWQLVLLCGETMKLLTIFFASGLIKFFVSSNQTNEQEKTILEALNSLKYVFLILENFVFCSNYP